MNEYIGGVITGVIISAVATLALAPVTGHIHASVAESRMEAAMEEVMQSLPDLPSPEDWNRQLQENIDRYMPR